jgi:hypothetical protein
MSQIQLPKQFTGVPPIIQQLVETVASEGSWATTRFNAKQTLINTRDCINWALDKYMLTENTKSKKHR